MTDEQFFRNVQIRIETMAGQLATERLGLDPHGRKDEEAVRQWAALREQYITHAMDNLASVLAGLSMMDLDIGPESLAPPPQLR